ncbi:MAG: alkaline phosphatase family protein [Gammaproteobacteria bacterium]|nr:alkaline phosphatase family protein [Gammaproteobacteria bacterium]
MRGERLLCAALLALVAFAARAAGESPAPPKLLVVISVDQFSGDLFNEYRAHFSGGLARLQEGVVFPRAYQSHAATETCPGHSTLLTGARPARTGIIANRWIDQSVARPDKVVYCMEDETAPDSDSKNYQASLRHLRVPTLGDRLKAASSASRVVSVAGKDRSALLMGGKGSDQTWWWGGRGFTSLAGKRAPPAVAKLNEMLEADIPRPAAPLALPDFCAARSDPVTLVDGRVVGAERFARGADDLRGFAVSPSLDLATLALASALRDELDLGRGPAVDLLAIGLSATDLIGHAYGTEGGEMCLQMAALDRALGEFLATLDARGVEYLVALTSDHGGHDTPERAQLNAIPDDVRVDKTLRPDAFNAAVAKRAGLDGAVLVGTDPAGDFYLARSLDAAARRKVTDAALALWRAHPQVRQVFTREQILASPAPVGPPDHWSLLEEVKASYDPERSGDFYVVLDPRVTPIDKPEIGYIATHGSPWDYDRRVPLIFWRPGIEGFEQPNSVETVDLLPTLAAQIGLAVPSEEIDGRCLDLDRADGDACVPR